MYLKFNKFCESRETLRIGVIIIKIFTIKLWTGNLLMMSCIAFILMLNIMDVSAAEDKKFIDISDEYNSSYSPIADVVDIKVSDSESIRIGVGDNKTVSKVDSSSISDIEDSSKPTGIGVEVSEILKFKDIVEEEVKIRIAIKAKTYSETNTQGGLVDIANPDDNYTTKKLSIKGEDRRILEALVQGEAGNQGFIGAAMVAQCIKDMYFLGNFSSVNAVRTNCGYSGSIKGTPCQDVKDAVAYIFDEGGYAVKHRMLYFYAPRIVRSGFHESQNLIVDYKNHRFFDRWN